MLGRAAALAAPNGRRTCSATPAAARPNNRLLAVALALGLVALAANIASHRKVKRDPKKQNGK